jgi:hypothetical protein
VFGAEFRVGFEGPYAFRMNKPVSASKPPVKVTQQILNSIHITPKPIFDPFFWRDEFAKLLGAKSET